MYYRQLRQFSTVLYLILNSKGVLSSLHEDLISELYSKYMEAVDSNTTTSYRRLFKDNREFKIHVKKLKEVNGLKNHNLFIKEKLRLGQNQSFIYINNPVESKIPNAFLTLDEFKEALVSRVFSTKNNVVTRKSKKWKRKTTNIHATNILVHRAPSLIATISTATEAITFTNLKKKVAIRKSTTRNHKNIHIYVTNITMSKSSNTIATPTTSDPSALVNVKKKIASKKGTTWNSTTNKPTYRVSNITASEISDFTNLTSAPMKIVEDQIVGLVYTKPDKDITTTSTHTNIIRPEKRSSSVYLKQKSTNFAIKSMVHNANEKYEQMTTKLVANSYIYKLNEVTENFTNKETEQNILELTVNNIGIGDKTINTTINTQLNMTTVEKSSSRVFFINNSQKPSTIKVIEQKTTVIPNTVENTTVDYTTAVNTVILTVMEPTKNKPKARSDFLFEILSKLKIRYKINKVVTTTTVKPMTTRKRKRLERPLVFMGV